MKQTALVLSQFLTGGGARKLVGRSSNSVRTPLMREKTTLTRERFTPSPDDAKNLLLMSQLPPELTISSPGLSQMGESKVGSFSQFSGLPSNPLATVPSPLGRTFSDSHTKLRQNDSFTRRKLESEDSSYNSDHDNLAATLSFNPSNPLSHHQLSKSHDDVSRTHLDCDFDMKTLVQDPQYFSKVTLIGFPILHTLIIYLHTGRIRTETWISRKIDPESFDKGWDVRVPGTELK